MELYPGGVTMIKWHKSNFFYIALNQRELARKLAKRILYLHQVSQKSEERGQKFADMENVGIFLQLLIILNVLNIRIKYSFS